MVWLANMGPSHTSEAVILRSRPYGESDKIVTFLAADVGKLTGIAKGAKNSRRRFANCLDAFTRVRIHFRTRAGAGLAFLESCDLLEPPGALADPGKFAYGSYLIELVDQLTGEAHPVPELYDLLVEALKELRDGMATAVFLRVFELRLLHHAGYAPQLSHCANCQRPVGSAKSAYLDTQHGGIVCVDCRIKGPSLIPIAPETLQTLQDVRAVSLRAARTRRLPPAVAAEAAQVMGRLLALHLTRPLRSIKLIAALTR